MFIHAIWWVGYDVFYISAEKTKTFKYRSKAPELHDLLLLFYNESSSLGDIIHIGEKTF